MEHKDLWTMQIYWELSEIFNKWGFDDEVQPLVGRWDNGAEQRYRQAAEEIEKRIEQLGLLEEYIDIIWVSAGQFAQRNDPVPDTDYRRLREWPS
jgi:hypothetical protein